MSVSVCVSYLSLFLDTPNTNSNSTQQRQEKTYSEVHWLRTNRNVIELFPMTPRRQRSPGRNRVRVTAHGIPQPPSPHTVIVTRSCSSMACVSAWFSLWCRASDGALCRAGPLRGRRAPGGSVLAHGSGGVAVPFGSASVVGWRVCVSLVGVVYVVGVVSGVVLSRLVARAAATQLKSSRGGGQAGR